MMRQRRRNAAVDRLHEHFLTGRNQRKTIARTNTQTRRGTRRSVLAAFTARGSLAQQRTSQRTRTLVGDGEVGGGGEEGGGVGQGGAALAVAHGELDLGKGSSGEEQGAARNTTRDLWL